MPAFASSLSRTTSRESTNDFRDIERDAIALFDEFVWSFTVTFISTSSLYSRHIVAAPCATRGAMRKPSFHSNGAFAAEMDRVRIDCCPRLFGNSICTLADICDNSFKSGTSTEMTFRYMNQAARTGIFSICAEDDNCVVSVTGKVYDADDRFPETISRDSLGFKQIVLMESIPYLR